MLWTQTTLSKLSDIQTGPFGSQLHASDYVSEGIPTIMPQDIIGNRVVTDAIAHIREEDAIRLAKYRVCPGDIVYSRRGDVERHALIEECEKGWLCGTGCLRVRPSSDLVTPRYLHYYLYTPESRSWITAHAHGSTMPNLNTTILGEVPICYPSIDEQQTICGILDSFDNRINNNTQINDNLAQQAMAIFKEWFLETPKAVEWPVVTLGSITSQISRGIAPKYAEDSEQIVINQKCIRDHSIDIGLARAHMPKAITEKWIQYGDLLINSTGEGTLGRAAQVWFIPENITVDSHVTIVRPQNQLLIFYIGFWGMTHEREFEALHTGSTGQTELPRDRVRAMRLRLPDDDLLAKFNVIIRPMVSTVVANQRENEKLAGVRNAFLPRLMSGEIDVSDILL